MTSINSLTQPSLWVVSVHDMAPRGFLGFDVKDILACLGPGIHDCSWLISNQDDLECTGEGRKPLLDAVEGSPAPGLVVSAAELAAFFEDTQQTIDGTIVGISKNSFSSKDLEALGEIERFPETEAQIIIRAVDSSFFEIMTKNPNDIKALKKRFKDVREEAPHKFFGVGTKAS